MRATCTVLFGTAGLAWTIGQAVLPDLGQEWDERYEAVAAARGLEALSAGLLVVAGAALVLGAVSLTRRVTRSRLLAAGVALTALGSLWLVGGRAAFNLEFYRATHESVTREAALSYLEAPIGPGFVPLVLMLPALLLGPILLAVGLRRAGLAGWAPLGCWVVGMGTFLATEFTVKAGEIAGIGLAGVALFLIGRTADRAALREGYRADLADHPPVRA